MANKYIKLLKEKEKLLIDIETKLSDQLKNLKVGLHLILRNQSTNQTQIMTRADPGFMKEEIYLLTVLTQQTNGDEDGEEERLIEVTVAEDMDNDAINRVPLTHLNAASENFYQMFAGNDSQREQVEEIEDEDEEEEEELEQEEIEMKV